MSSCSLPPLAVDDFGVDLMPPALVDEDTVDATRVSNGPDGDFLDVDGMANLADN